MASILDLPIVLVVDAHGAGRSLLPLLAGFLRYDKEQRINGVILNKTSEHFYRSLAPVIEEELHLPVWGFLPKKQELSLESRHLGLKLPEEICGLQEQIRQAAVLLEKYVRIDAILEAAKRRRVIPLAETAGACAGRDVSHGADAHTACVRKQPTVRIGVARDDAFCFYYEENLNLLEEKGADLVYFSPLEDPKLPDNLDGLLLGGGYPELYAGRLSENASMRDAIKSAITGGMPSAAECGGFLYLHESLTDENGRDFAMCGVIPGRCFYTGKSVRFGYIEPVEKETAFLENGAPVKGHEFHYYDSEHNGKSCTAVKPVTAKGGNAYTAAEIISGDSRICIIRQILRLQSIC